MKKLHLIISVLVVVPVGCIYGFNPELLFDVKLNSIDEANIFKAIMGLYLGFSILWIIGILKPKLWQLATVSNMIFMLSLGLSRIISILLDGTPALLFIIGTIGEVVLGLYAFYQLKNEKSFD